MARSYWKVEVGRTFIRLQERICEGESYETGDSEDEVGEELALRRMLTLNSGKRARKYIFLPARHMRSQSTFRCSRVFRSKGTARRSSVKEALGYKYLLKYKEIRLSS